MVRVSEVLSYWMEEDSPVITISGTWLREYGFEIGRKIVVDVIKGQIIIKLIDVDE